MARRRTEVHIGETRPAPRRQGWFLSPSSVPPPIRACTLIAAPSTLLIQTAQTLIRGLSARLRQSGCPSLGRIVSSWLGSWNSSPSPEVGCPCSPMVFSEARLKPFLLSNEEAEHVNGLETYNVHSVSKILHEDPMQVHIWGRSLKSRSGHRNPRLDATTSHRQDTCRVWDLQSC